MNKIILKLGLFVSSFVPLYFLIISKILIEIINGNLSFNILNTTMLFFLILLCLFGIFVLIKALCSCKKNAKSEIVITEKNNSTDQYFLGYFSLFVLFAISYEIEMLSMAFVFFIVLIFIAVVYIKNDLYFINPLLNIWGYSFYDIKYYKANNKEQILSARIFFKGRIVLNKKYKVNFNNPNFCFLTK